MAEIKTLVDDKIQSFLQELRHAGYHITRAYVFGSYVSGRIDEWSDMP
jgi:predicted nucleotidyltransferase